MGSGSGVAGTERAWGAADGDVVAVHPCGGGCVVGVGVDVVEDLVWVVSCAGVLVQDVATWALVVVLWGQNSRVPLSLWAHPVVTPTSAAQPIAWSA